MYYYSLKSLHLLQPLFLRAGGICGGAGADGHGHPQQRLTAADHLPERLLWVSSLFGSSSPRATRPIGHVDYCSDL